MKPGDHPEFFRFPPPEGRSRESTIHLDKNGRFWHDGEPVEHAGMAKAFAAWISKHPDDGRFILTNGYDWTYFSVEDTPFFITRVIPEPGQVVVELSDGTAETLDLETLSEGAESALFAQVKAGAYAARFTQSAQLGLAPLLVEDSSGRVLLEVGQRRYAIPARKA